MYLSEYCLPKNLHYFQLLNLKHQNWLSRDFTCVFINCTLWAPRSHGLERLRFLIRKTFRRYLWQFQVIPSVAQKYKIKQMHTACPVAQSSWEEWRLDVSDISTHKFCHSLMWWLFSASLEPSLKSHTFWPKKLVDGFVSVLFSSLSNHDLIN